MLELDRSNGRGGTEGPKLLEPRAPVTTKPFLLGAFVAPVLAIHLCAGHAVAACSFENRISFSCQIEVADGHDRLPTPLTQTARYVEGWRLKIAGGRTWAVCNSGGKAFRLNRRVLGCLCAQGFDAAFVVQFSRDRHKIKHLYSLWRIASSGR